MTGSLESRIRNQEIAEETIISRIQEINVDVTELKEWRIKHLDYQRKNILHNAIWTKVDHDNLYKEVGEILDRLEKLEVVIYGKTK